MVFLDSIRTFAVEASRKLQSFDRSVIANDDDQTESLEKWTQNIFVQAKGATANEIGPEVARHLAIRQRTRLTLNTQARWQLSRMKRYKI